MNDERDFFDLRQYSRSPQLSVYVKHCCRPLSLWREINDW
nr:MAG TPA_asm: hypothetical protein [Caudoviricetes sp.]